MTGYILGEENLSKIKSFYVNSAVRKSVIILHCNNHTTVSRYRLYKKEKK